ncbi:MAG TPA: uroporphyrinogen-III C-methyltransferase [Acidiferrobacterales bacterium]|nr:uroporphyrinogen-III C-methyltransferase [Acidiferrobacterales bacterium]
MAQDTDTPPAPSAKKRASRRAPGASTHGRTGRFAAGLALVLAIVAMLASGYVSWLVNSKRGLSDAKGRLVNVEQDTAQLQALSAQMNQELATLRETQETLKSGVQALHGEIGKGRRAWLIAETENLLVMAQHRLSYARDARQALAALRVADRQLQQLGDPDYLPVRKLLESEIGALESFERLDLSGMAQRLGQLGARVNTLAFAPDPVRPTGEPATDGEQGFLREVWKDLRNLVSVRTTTDVRRPLLLAEQKYFLRENLRLMLYGAQVALLHGDFTTVESNTKAARQWLGDFFDAGTPAVQSAANELDAVLKTHALDLPDVSMSLKALREITARRTAS